MRPPRSLTTKATSHPGARSIATLAWMQLALQRKAVHLILSLQTHGYCHHQRLCSSA